MTGIDPTTINVGDTFGLDPATEDAPDWFWQRRTRCHVITLNRRSAP